MFDVLGFVGGVRSSRGVASVAVMCLVGGLSGVGLVGTGLSGSVLGALPGSAWLSSSERGDVVLANGANGVGVARLGVPGLRVRGCRWCSGVGLRVFGRRGLMVRRR